MYNNFFDLANSIIRSTIRERKNNDRNTNKLFIALFQLTFMLNYYYQQMSAIARGKNECNESITSKQKYLKLCTQDNVQENIMGKNFVRQISSRVFTEIQTFNG